MKSKEELKSFFENGDIPKQDQFWEWQDSYWHKEEKLPLENVDYDFSNKADLVNGKIPATQLPSYVDDILEFDSLEDLPNPGEGGKIYIVTSTNTQLRWTGSEYIKIISGENVMITDSPQEIFPDGKKTFWTDNDTNSLHIKNTNSEGAGITFDSNGIGQIIYNDDQFHFTNSDGTNSIPVVSEGFKKEGSNNEFYLTGGGDHVHNLAKEDAWYHSTRDFPNGTLIETDVDYSQDYGDQFLLEIKGNMYDNSMPLDAKVQGYIYLNGTNPLLNLAGYTTCYYWKSITALNRNGKLCFWFPRLSYWQGFDVKLTVGYGGIGQGKNRVTRVIDSPDPIGTKRVDIYLKTLATQEFVSSQPFSNITSAQINNWDNSHSKTIVDFNKTSSHNGDTFTANKQDGSTISHTFYGAGIVDTRIQGNGLDSDGSSTYIPNSSNPNLDYKVTPLFHDGSRGWQSSLLLKGWGNNYKAWKITGDANADDVERDVYISSSKSSDGTWLPERKIWTEKNFNPDSKTNALENATAIGFQSGLSTGFPYFYHSTDGYIPLATRDWTGDNFYTKPEVDAKFSAVYRPKGSVANHASLPSSGNTEGDVWNLLDTGANVVWVTNLNNTGVAGWDKLSETVDLTNYVTTNTFQVDIAKKWFNGATSNDFGGSAIQVNGNQTNGIYPSIGFHQPGNYAGTISLRNSNQFSFRNTDDSDYNYLLSKGYIKSGSSNDYLLLGGGDHDTKNKYIFGDNDTGSIQGYSPSLGLPPNSFYPKKSGFYRPNNENDYGSLYLHIMHPDAPGGQYSAGIAFDYSGENAWLTGIDSGGVKMPNKKIWTSGNFNPDKYVDKTTNDQQVTSRKLFYTIGGGNYTNNSLHVVSNDGNYPAIAFQKVGVANAQIKFSGSEFLFTNADGTLTVPTIASGYYRAGSSDSFVLTGGGGHKAISDFALASDLSGYVTLNTYQEIEARKVFRPGTGNKYDEASLELRGNNASSIYPTLSFHQPGFYAATLSFRPNGFNFMNDQGTILTNVNAAKFIKGGSDDSYLLLGGGGHRPASDFALSSQLGNYLPLSGGTLTGDGRIDSTGTIYLQQTSVGGNATGLFWETIDNSARISGIGALTTNGILEYNYIGWGASPWQVANALVVSDTLLRYKGDNIALENWVSTNYIPKTHPVFNITQNNIDNWSTYLGYVDDRQITPSDIPVQKLKFGFTSWNNDNLGEYADFLHFGGYSDGSGGNQNLIMFNKNSFGLRQYHGSSQGTSPYSSYVDYYHTGNLDKSKFHNIDSDGAIDNGSNTRTNKSWFDYNWAGTGLRGSVINFSGLGGNYSTELFGSYDNPNYIGIRTRNGDTNSWNPVKYLFHSGNFDPSNYISYAGAIQDINLNTKKLLNIGTTSDHTTESIQAAGKIASYGNENNSVKTFVSSAGIDTIVAGHTNQFYNTIWKVGNKRGGGANSLGYSFEFSNDGGITYTEKARIDDSGFFLGNAFASPVLNGNQVFNANNSDTLYFGNTSVNFVNYQSSNLHSFYAGGNYPLVLSASGGYFTGNIQLNGYNVLTEAQRGVANGFAPLGADSKISSAYLPSYVDDVLEFANLAAFPATGESGKIYVALDTNLTYRWGGSSYILISSGAVQSVNGQTGVVNLSKTDVGLANVDNTSDLNKPVSTATQAALNGKEGVFSKNTAFNKNFGTTSGTVTEGNHVGSGGAAHANATTSTAGFMSSADKTKLDNIDTSNFVALNTNQTVTGSKNFADGSQIQFLGGDGNHIIPQRIPGGSGAIVSGHDYTHYNTRWRVGNVRGGSTDSTALGFYFSSDNGATFSNRVSIDAGNGQINTAIHGNSAEWNDIAQNGVRSGSSGFTTLQHYREIDDNAFDIDDITVEKFNIVFDASANGQVVIHSLPDGQTYHFHNFSASNILRIDVEGYGNVDNIEPGETKVYMAHHSGHLRKISTSTTDSII